MFGKNEIRKQELGDGNELQIKEIFPTIQGEGPFAGEPAIFVRLSGCNLKCYFCDTDFEGGDFMRLDTIFDAIHEAEQHVNTKLIVLTGGEPFRQNIVPLTKILLEGGYTVQIETAGTLWLDELTQLHLDYDDLHIVVSPKTGKLNLDAESHADAYKYIIEAGKVDSTDGLPIYSTQIEGKKQRLARPTDFSLAEIYIQPCDAHDEKQNELNIKQTAQVAMHYGYRVSLQMHKYLGVE